MKRSWHLLAAAWAAALILAVGDVGVANVQYNFNSTSEGWEFGTILPLSGTSPSWEFHKEPSATDGAIRALLVESGSGAGAWAMSPCLEIEKNRDTVHVDISHWTAFPMGILGQVQFRIDPTGTSGFGLWQGITGTSWLGPADNHLPPTQADLTGYVPPLVEYPINSGTNNVNLAFSGTHNATTDFYAKTSPTGEHVNSAFDIVLAEYGLSAGSEIQFQFMVATDRAFPTQSPVPVLWEVNSVQIIGVKECVVPEPGTLALAGGAIGCGLAGLVRRRLCRRGRRPDRTGRSDPSLLHL